MYKVINRDDLTIKYGTCFYENQEDVPSPGDTVEVYTDGEGDSPETFDVIEIMHSRESHTDTHGVLYVRSARQSVDEVAEITQSLDGLSKNFHNMMNKSMRRGTIILEHVGMGTYRIVEWLNTVVCPPDTDLTSNQLIEMMRAHPEVDFKAVGKDKL